MAARTIVQREGIGALTMRRVAQELASSPMAIYRHVRDKDQLLVLLLDRLAAEVPRTQLPRDPRARLQQACLTMRDGLAQHPWVVDVLAEGDLIAPSILWLMEEIVAGFVACGLSHAQAVDGYRAVWQFTVGELMVHRGHDRMAKLGRPPFVIEVLTTVDPDALPTLGALAPEWARARSRDSFEPGLTALLDGLIAREEIIEGWPPVYAHLRYDDPDAAIPWLSRVFGLRERERMSHPDGRVITSKLEGPKGGLIMIAGKPREWLRERLQAFQEPQGRSWPDLSHVVTVLVRDVDAHHAHADANGVTILMPPIDQPWGLRVYAAVDLEGHQWEFGQVLRATLTPAGQQRDPGRIPDGGPGAAAQSPHPGAGIRSQTYGGTCARKPGNPPADAAAERVRRLSSFPPPGHLPSAVARGRWCLAECGSGNAPAPGTVAC